MTQSSRAFPFQLVVPFLLLLACIFIAGTNVFHEHMEVLSKALTLDLLLTIPLIYLFLIRKKQQSKVTVLPIVVIGMLVATVIIPKPYHSYLDLFKDYVLPVLEFGVLIYLFITVRKALRMARTARSFENDFHDLTRSIATRLFPERLGTIVATELSMIYYGFVKWRTDRRQGNEFSYHKSTSTPLLLGVFIFLILIETAAFHLLLQQWSLTAAWILTVLSSYTCFQVFAVAKSVGQRPLLVTGEFVKLRWGIMRETKIPLETIESISLFTKELPGSDDLTHLSPFHSSEGTNVSITLTKKHTLHQLYGFKRTYQRILLYADAPESFIKSVTKSHELLRERTKSTQ